MSMASTTNQVGSSSFPSSSSTPHWNYDVFLSFRGTDTRRNFTSHLFTALKDAGIKTFMDDEELPTGKEIKPELRKAIRESKMSIIVFSKNYASSRWCLDELVEILECKRTMGQLVLPLFYDVEPSVVRYQTGNYAQAFQKFVDKWDKPKVKNWRDALKEAADLSGHVLANEEDG